MDSVTSERHAGIILCGGGSRRMGCDKAWLPFGDRRMLQRVVDTLQQVVQPVVAVASQSQILPPLPSAVEVVYDPEEGRGPLQGIVSGLEAVAGRADAAFLSSCDAPLLRPGFVTHLLDALGEYDIVVPKEGEYYHPLCAVYRASLLPVANEVLRAGRGRIDGMYPRCRVHALPVDSLRAVDENLDSLLNANVPDDYRAALAAAGVPQTCRPENGWGVD